MKSMPPPGQWKYSKQLLSWSLIIVPVMVARTEEAWPRARPKYDNDVVCLYSLSCLIKDKKS